MSLAKSHFFQGGAFLIGEGPTEAAFFPEQFTEEQQMIREMCDAFIAAEVRPHLVELDRQEPGLMESLLEKSGEQGLLGAAFPEQYGGLDKDFVTATLINEALGAGHSYSVAMAAHTGIGSLPLLYFGTPAQKEKYLPGLATGTLKAAYALSEPDAGSDALSVRTTARRTADGKQYVLNGQKCWITNSGFADLFTVFAKVDGAAFTAFLVEKNTPGFSLGEEEHKMGIKGSSTRQLFFEEARIPADQLLGEVGKGHKIAFNILNIGRLKLCAAALGAAKSVAETSRQYALQRQQFGQPIARFGAIQYKLAEQAIRIYATESALYRTAGYLRDLEAQLREAGTAAGQAAMQAAEEYAVECAILKVAGSEMLDYVVDEAVQIHGGNGFIDEYEVSRSYRDSRINRIFEGTNEINRLLIPGMLLKRALKGRLDLMTPAQAAQAELTALPDLHTDSPSEVIEMVTRQLGGIRKAILLVAGAAAQQLGDGLQAEQELMMYLADMLARLYQAESMLLRHQQDKDKDLSGWMLQVYVYDTLDHCSRWGKAAVNSFVEGDNQRMLLMGLRRFLKPLPALQYFNTTAARRKIADALTGGLCS